jgi:hypothetical protein
VQDSTTIRQDQRFSLRLADLIGSSTEVSRVERLGLQDESPGNGTVVPGEQPRLEDKKARQSDQIMLLKRWDGPQL